MKIKLPKSLIGFAYDRLSPVDLNHLEVDILLPSIFFKVISGGRDRGRKANDPTRIREYVAKLAENPDVAGFDGAEGMRLLDRLVRTSLVEIGWRGQVRSTREEQIRGLTGHTYLTFKTGFPTETSSLRRVDALIYRMMREQLRSDGGLRDFFEHVFGKGLEVTGGAEPDGRYDGSTALDTTTRLSVAFLDGFASTGVRPARDRPVREACPALEDRMARDLRRYLQAYHERMPAEALSYYLKALINAELFFYSVKLFYAAIELVEHPNELPPAMRRSLEPSPPDVYLDFIGSATGLSREMAAYCVRRELESIHRFVAANLTLRQLDRYVRQLRGDRRVGEKVSEVLGEDEGGPEYLQALLGLLDEPIVSARIDAAAQRDEDEIRRENGATDQEETEQGLAELDQIAAAANSDFERVVLLLVEGQRRKTVQNVVAWYWSVGGLTKAHGVLAGTRSSRQSWRYAPSNDLLATLVQLAAVDIPKWDHENPCPKSIKLREFLDWLEERFGVIVDHPPEGLVGADYAAAARDNLAAMLHRLRQMGMFRDLSDDFTVQRLVPPYATSGDTGGREDGR